MTSFAAYILGLCVIGVFVALLIAGEASRIVETAGGRGWPWLRAAAWLVLPFAALHLVGRFAVVLAPD